MIITITGPSGCGKTETARQLLARWPNSQMILSYTDREPRGNDVPGEYACISHDEFERMRAATVFEWVTPPHRGRNYGTASATLDEVARNIQNNWIIVLQPDYIARFTEAMRRRGSPHVIRSFFLCAPSNNARLKERLVTKRKMTSAAADEDILRHQTWYQQTEKLHLGIRFIPDYENFEDKFAKIFSQLPEAA
jgi:guanylate kinase